MLQPEYASQEGKTISYYSWPIRRIFRDHDETLNDPVLMEEPLEIIINAHRIAILMRMPGQEKELAAGFCVSEGYVRRVKDILLIHHCGLGFPAPDEADAEEAQESRNRIEIRVAEGCYRFSNTPEETRLIRSGCGAADVSSLSENLPRLPTGMKVEAKVILGLGKAMRNLQELHERVGGTHSAALFTVSGESICMSEDIGRHNAVDKAVGYCLLRRIGLEDKILVTSGRASYEMAVKAIRLGMPIVATISAPTSLAVQIAQAQGLTLIGYLRGGRMNVYTHGKRVHDSFKKNQ